MKTIGLTALLLFTGLTQAQKLNLTVVMSGFKSNDGKVKIGLYNSEGNFLKAPVKTAISEIKNNQAAITFEGIEKGEYAVSVYHDENNNGEMDKGFMGIPKEGYGTSNDAKGMMGPPKYADAKFQLKTNSKIKITINN